MRSTVAQLRVNADSVVEVSVRPVKQKSTSPSKDATRSHLVTESPERTRGNASPPPRRDPIGAALEAASALAHLPEVKEPLSAASSTRDPSPSKRSSRSASAYGGEASPSKSAPSPTKPVPPSIAPKHTNGQSNAARKPTPIPLSLPLAATALGVAPSRPSGPTPSSSNGRRNGTRLAAFSGLTPVSEEVPEPPSRPPMPSRPRSITTAAAGFNTALNQEERTNRAPGQSPASTVPSPGICSIDESDSSGEASTQPTSRLTASRSHSDDLFVTPCSTPTTYSDQTDDSKDVTLTLDGKGRRPPGSEESRTPTSLNWPGTPSYGIIPLEERRARARSLGDGGSEPSQHYASLDAAAFAGSSPSLAGANLASSLPSLPVTSKSSSLRSGTPDVEMIAARKKAAQEAARFALQRCSPRPVGGGFPRSRAGPEVAEESSRQLCDPLKRAINPICQALERVGHAVAPCSKTDDATSFVAPEHQANAASRASLDVMKTVSHAFEVEELPSRRLEREDRERRRRSELGGSVSLVAAEQVARAIEAAELCKGPTPVTGGYESTVSAVTMAQAVNRATAGRALQVLR